MKVCIIQSLIIHQLGLLNTPTNWSLDLGSPNPTRHLALVAARPSGPLLPWAAEAPGVTSRVSHPSSKSQKIRPHDLDVKAPGGEKRTEKDDHQMIPSHNETAPPWW